MMMDLSFTVHEETVTYWGMLLGLFAAGDLKISEEWIMKLYSYKFEHMPNGKKLKEELIIMWIN